MVSPPPVNEVIRHNYDFPKIELHLHLDGSIRHSTLLELSQAKHIALGGAKTVEDVKRLLVSHEPANLAKVLAAFDLFLPCVVGDKDAIERIAYEKCQDQAENGVIYFEARYSPHLLCNTTSHYVWHMDTIYKEKGPLTPEGVIEAIKSGFDRGEKDFGVKARSILCCIRGFEVWNNEVIELATDLKHLGVVGIDVAGSAHGADEQYDAGTIHVFKEAYDRNIHRTVHAGESGGPKEVVNAIDTMHAERIGHGYRMMRDENVYEKYGKTERIHFEACPYSSIMTGSVGLDWAEHPVARWAKDEINFSISTDDPTCFDNCVLSELRIAQHEIGLNVHQLWQCQLNAAKSCFLPEDEKKELIDKILKAEPLKN